MAKSITKILENFDSNKPSPVETMVAVERQFGIEFPADYKRFMADKDGGEGFVGSHYLILWRSSELVEFNRDYEVEKYAPGLIFFGSNGGGEAYAFDARSKEKMAIRMVPFVGMSLQEAEHIADTFEDFLCLLDETNESLLKS